MPSSASTSTRDHWEEVYRRTAAEAVSWYRPHLEISLDMIRRAASDPGSSILDVGGGESTLVNDLIAAGYRNVAVLDVSPTALEATKKRLGAAAGQIRWIAGDVTAVTLPQHSVDVWHDRAVFHFLTEPEDRAAYVRNLLDCVRPGGHVVIGAFGTEGPSRCSGLPVVRYDSETMHRELGGSLVNLETREELHFTPRGIAQQFVYCLFRLAPVGVLQNT